jgi:hypothetical protein
MNEWYIITPNYSSGKCENPQAPNCGQSDKLLWIKKEGKPKLFTPGKLYVCAECVKKDFKLVGDWAQTWEKEFTKK